MTARTSTDRQHDEPARRALWESPAAGVAMIAAASTVLAVLAPDLVSGSEHEHLPLAALTVWPWAASAIGFVLMAARRDHARELVIAVSFVWVLVAVIAITVPPLVTGTDPTRIPLAALVAPPFGAVATGFLSISHARSGAGREPWSATDA